MQIQILEIANTDNLTGLSNRIVLMDRLEQALKQRNLKHRQCSILFIDIDDFKSVNDTKGHHIGDELLIEVAKKLKKIVRKGDTVARIGGDEFILLLKYISNQSDASYVAQKVLNAFEKPIYIEKYVIKVNVSIGISIFPDDGKKAEVILSNADYAMYYVKKHGKNNYKFYADIK